MRSALIIAWLLTVACLFGQEHFRPKVGTFTPLEKGKTYSGELVYVDHVNRRGSLRLHVDDHYHEGKLHHFAMLPDGLVRYHGAPASLKDIPLGTVLTGRFFLPPDPKLSVVPIVDPRRKDVTRPPENYALLLEDQMSLCLREKRAWQLKEIQMKGTGGTLVVQREGKGSGDGWIGEHKITVDESTRIWRGRELLALADLVADGTWPKAGTKDLGLSMAHLGLTWHPRYLYEQFHLSDLWLDEATVQGAVRRQTAKNVRHVKMRWMPALIEEVANGKNGQAIVTATLFGGRADSLYRDFKTGSGAQMAAAETTLRTWWPDHDGMDGRLVEVAHLTENVPFGSSGVRLNFDTDLVLEGFRPGRIVKIRSHAWPKVKPPYEELIKGPADRWPIWEGGN